MEEISGSKVDGSMIKKIVSQDLQSGRGLFGSNQEVKLDGKLMMNANVPPALGDEPAIWDRAVFIPWDTRYVQQGDKVDLKKWKLPSSNTKKDEIVSLNSAFVSVCLWELHKFLTSNGNMASNGTLNVSEIPMPQCVRDKTNELRMRANPLMTFTKAHSKESIGQRVKMNLFYLAFKGYTRSVGMHTKLDQVQVMDKLITIPLLTSDDGNVQYVNDITLSPEAIEMGENQALAQNTNPLKRAFEFQNNHNKRRPSDIAPPPLAHVKNQYCILNSCKGPHIEMDAGDLELY